MSRFPSALGLVWRALTLQTRWESLVSSSLPQYEQRRAELYEQLANTGDFRRGTINATYRRCGKPNCRCAEPADPGHGPRYLLSRTVNGKTESRQLDVGAELDKANREVTKYKQFQATLSEIVEVNEAICDARPISPSATQEPGAVTDREKGGSSRTSKRTPPRR